MFGHQWSYTFIEKHYLFMHENQEVILKIDLEIVTFLSVALRKIPNSGTFRMKSKQSNSWESTLTALRTHVCRSQNICDIQQRCFWLSVWMNCGTNSVCQSCVWFKKLQNDFIFWSNFGHLQSKLTVLNYYCFVFCGMVEQQKDHKLLRSCGMKMQLIVVGVFMHSTIHGAFCQDLRARWWF